MFSVFALPHRLPALIVFSERKEKRRAPKLFLHSFGSGKLIDLSIARPRVTILAWCAFILVCGALATRLRFSDNIQDLRAKGNPGVVNQTRVTEKFGQSFDFMMYVSEGKSMDEVLAKTYAATRDLELLVRDGTIASFQSLSTFLPPATQQAQVIAALRAGQSDRFNMARIEKTFRAALLENGFRPEAYDDTLRLFAQSLTPTEPATPSEGFMDALFDDLNTPRANAELFELAPRRRNRFDRAPHSH